ncbi:HAD-like domain-containing protein [Globomyces pollinis-pini]|nr:HAD-like domain-containing protein [Globomyces pollinis-pini]
MKITHVLFDMDGLLLDTESVYTIVTTKILERYGKQFTWDLKSTMMGQKERDAAEFLISQTQIPLTVDEYLKERSEGHAKLFPHCKPLPGVLKLITHLKHHQIPIAVATSSHQKAFDIKTENNQHLFQLFDGNVIVGDHPSIKNGKPSPDIFQQAAKLIGNSNPETCLVFEDAVSGVQAGLNAGMHVVWVPDVRMELDSALVDRCCEVLKSMEDFDPTRYGLPSYV